MINLKQHPSTIGRLLLLVVLLVCNLTASSQTESFYPSDAMFTRFLGKNLIYPEKASDDDLSCVILAKVNINSIGQIDTFNCTEYNNIFSNEIERLLRLAMKSNFTFSIKNEILIVPFVFIHQTDEKYNPDDLKKNPIYSPELWENFSTTTRCYFLKPIVCVGWGPYRKRDIRCP